jgi:protocatechuate 3,4-dioxygenase alpha subunit
MLEFWSASGGKQDSANSQPSGIPREFRRAVTDPEGRFSTVMPRPAPVPIEGDRMQAPHLLALVFARGLLRNLITRVYFEGEPGNGSDPVLLSIPPERRGTLIAQREAANAFCWNVRLQGADETVFFAW